MTQSSHTTPGASYPLTQHHKTELTPQLCHCKSLKTHHKPNQISVITQHTGATYLHISMPQVLQKLTAPQLVKKHPTFHETHQCSFILFLEDSF